jgi:hypothetical protein
VTETSTTKTTVVEREAVEYLAWLSALAIDGQIELPEFLGNDKNWAFARASDILTHQEHGAGGKRSIRLIPVSFKIIGFHKDMVEEFILDLGGEQVEADHPVFCVLARHAAKLADSSYSFDFRWDSRQALDVVWPASKQP